MSTSRGGSSNGGGGASLLRDLLVSVWMVVVAVVFWGQYIVPGGLPAGVFTALYAAFLVLFVAAAALRMVRGREENTAPNAAGVEPEGEPRHGH